ncbi:MAG TPA: hypothetical protein VMM15_30350 [Bradyrhizobium sp.]|nr:hypothetical protein [Bradyrhizobium sp.]
MKSLNDRSFHSLWQMVYRAAAGSSDADRWRVGDVDWRRQRHHYSGPDYSFSIETHLLTVDQRGRSAWTLLVAIEHWWDSAHAPLRSSMRLHALAGNKRAIIEWFKDQGKQLELSS